MKHFFNDALTIYNESGTDEYGRESWGSGSAVNGRFVESSKNFYDVKGNTVTSDALIHIPANTTIYVGSKVVFDGENYKVIRMNKPEDGSGVRFIKAYLQILR